MKRRIFIQNTGTAAAVAALMPSLGFKVFTESDFPGNYQSFILQNFEEEQEESPSIVTDRNGNMWIFTLRRLVYPQDKELVSAFRFNGDTWEEMNPVTEKAGHYEAPVAACAPGGKPVVAWCEIISGKWQIKVSNLGENGFEKPERIKNNTGKPINPVLIAPDKNRCWIAWENYEKGKLKICISKYENAVWSEPVIIDKGKNSCFNPALVESRDGDLYAAYGLTDGFHQNIEMCILDGQSMQIKSTVPVAIGGGFKNRVNLNTNPAITFDALDRLWISYESNRNYIESNKNLKNIDRIKAGGDNFKGGRICAMVSYQDGKILETEKTGKWLFSGKNDHTPVFLKDTKGRLFAATYCGGDFVGNRYWKYRISWLDPEKGWTDPITLVETKQQGVLMPPALVFDKEDNLWQATCIEEVFNHDRPENHDGIIRSRLTKLMVNQYPSPDLTTEYAPLAFRETRVEEHHESGNFVMEVSGHPKIEGEEIRKGKESYTLVYGQLHEHSENSSCWPAGVDGTLHDDYRFGIFSEGYNFVAITDHGYHMTEVYWRKNLRIADFYNDPPYFVALPAFEWTKGGSDSDSEKTAYGAGHHNIIFASTEDALKFTRNRDEIFSRDSPETINTQVLWDFLRAKKINCITIPHHPAVGKFRVDWEVHDDEFVPVVELYQVRGSYEYPDCPLCPPYNPKHKNSFVDYPLREKKYNMGFIGGGEHTGMGGGVAALWIKELNREGILEAMKERRCFATTGDKMIVDFRINGSITGSVSKTDKAPALNIKVKAQRELEKVDVLRNSKVIKSYNVPDGSLEFEQEFSDEQYQDEKEICYYYIRATQKNNQILWSSPIWV